MTKIRTKLINVQDLSADITDDQTKENEENELMLEKL